jgi:hypothetical protein
MNRRQRLFIWLFTTSLLSVTLSLGTSAHAQEPIDLFPDNPELAPGFVRVCAWNLRHINLEEQARQFLPGQNDTEDFAILIATFAKGLRDLGCDLAAIVEVQPRSGELDRLLQLRDRLNGSGSGPWRADQTNIEYDNPNDPFGNLQFGLLWNSNKVTVDPTADQLLLDLRQPRDVNGNLTERRTRVPWLVPVRAGALEFDVLILHLKSGGDRPKRPKWTPCRSSSRCDSLHRRLGTSSS